MRAFPLLLGEVGGGEGGGEDLQQLLLLGCAQQTGDVRVVDYEVVDATFVPFFHRKILF